MPIPSGYEAPMAQRRTQRRKATVERRRSSTSRRGTRETARRMRLPPSERTGPENTHAFVAELLGKDVHMTRVIYAQHPAPHDPSSELLVLSTGGKGIVMRHEDLRESTRLAAEKKVNKLETRLKPGEKSNRKRMAQVAAVYSVAQWVRSASDVLHEVRPDDVAKRRPAPHDKRVWASVEQSPRKVIRAMFDEALRRDPDKRRRWVVLVDGEPRQLRAVKAEARRAGVKVTIHPRCRARPRVRVEGGACARRREQREGGEVGGRAPPRVAHRSPPSRAPATTSQTARERGS